MPLALFDLDETLLAGDSDYLWGQHLVEKGAVDGAYYEATNRAFYEQYKQGTLDIYEFARFAFKPLSEYPLQTLTLILKQHSRHGVLASITVHYLTNRGDLHFSAPLRYQCMDDKNRCFLEFAIEARYENNLEIELLYQTLNDPERVIEYRIKDIGVMSSLLQKKR